jgi:hypothetical protein
MVVGTRITVELTVASQMIWSRTYRCPVPSQLIWGARSRLSVDTELVALDVLHRDARIIAVIQRSHVYRAERDQSCAFGLKCGEALFTHESGADPHVKMQPVLDGLPFGDALEVQARAHT